MLSSYRSVLLQGVLLALAIVLTAAPVHAAGYVLTTVAGNADGFTDVAHAGIDEQGRLYFLATGSAGRGIYRHDGTTTVLLYGGGNGFTDIQGPFGVAPAGTVAFSGVSSSAGAGIFAGDGTTTVTIDASAGSTFGASASIDAFGTVTYWKDSAIWTGTGAGLGSIVADPLTFDELGEVPEIGGGVAFWGRRVGSSVPGIFLEGFPPTEVASPSEFAELGVRIAVAAPPLTQARVAFTGTPLSGASGVFLWAAGDRSTMVDATGPFDAFGDVSINEDALVVFVARLDGDSGHGLFAVQGLATADAPIIPVVIPGDSLDGGVVTAVSAFRAVNGSRQVAFLAQLEDGRTVVGRGDPAFSLTLTLAGTGAGVVTSSPAGIDCGQTCAALFRENTEVSLSGAPAAGSYLEQITGDPGCRGPLVMDGPKSCTALFALQVDLTVTQIKVPGSTAPGHLLSVTDVVLNRGPGATLQPAAVRYRLRSEAGEVELLGERLVSLDAGQSSSAKTEVMTPVSTPPGTYALVVCATAHRPEAEANAADDCLTSGKKINVRKS